MAQRAVEQVLAAFQRGWDSIRQQQQFETQEEQRKQEQADLKEYRQSELSHQQAVLDAQIAQQQAQQAANEKLFNLQKLPLLQQLGVNYAQTGITPAGASITPDVINNIPLPQITSGPLAGIPQGQQPPSTTGQTMTLPGGLGSISVLSPEAYATQQAARERILNAPREEAEARRIAAQNADMLQRQLELNAQTHKDTLEIMGRQEKFQDQQRLQTQAFQTGLQNSKNSLQLQLMGLKSGQAGAWGSTVTTDDDGELKIMPNDPTQRIQQAVDMVRDGTLSLEQAKKMFNAKQFPVIQDAVSKAGLSFLTDKELQRLTEAEPVAGLVDKLYQIHKLRLDSPLALQFPLTGATSQFNSLEGQIGGQLAGAAKFMNNVPRFTNVELQQVKNMLLPSKDIISHTGSEEFKKYENFTQNMQDALNTIIQRLPESQKNVIRQRFGFNSFPYLGSTMRTPGASVTGISGANPPGVNIPSGGGMPKPGQIYVRKKSTGQEGWMSPQYMNNPDYEKATPPGVK